MLLDIVLVHVWWLSVSTFCHVDGISIERRFGLVLKFVDFRRTELLAIMDTDTSIHFHCVGPMKGAQEGSCICNDGGYI